MGKPDVDEIEIAGGARAISQAYGEVIGEHQARNIAYTVLVGARVAKFDAVRSTVPVVKTPGSLAELDAILASEDDRLLTVNEDGLITEDFCEQCGGPCLRRPRHG